MNRRIAIVEDDPRYRAGLELLFRAEPGFDVVETHPAAEPLLDRARQAQYSGRPSPWEVVLVDIELPGATGIETTRTLKGLYPDLQIVVVTSFEAPDRILEAILAGADGYIVKKADPQEIIDDVRAVLDGGSPMTPGVARAVMALLRRGDSGPPSTAPLVDLTPRELDVLRALVRGLAYKHVATELELSIDTVRSHVRNLYRKLQVHSVAEAVSKALRERLV